jgi:hypothetical protein
MTQQVYERATPAPGQEGKSGPKEDSWTDPRGMEARAPYKLSECLANFRLWEHFRKGVSGVLSMHRASAIVLADGTEEQVRSDQRVTADEAPERELNGMSRNPGGPRACCTDNDSAILTILRQQTARRR